MARPRALVAVAACLATLAGCGGAAKVTPSTAEQQALDQAASGKELVRSVPGSRAVLWAAGDGGDGGAASRAVARLVRRGRPDRFLYLGDVYERGTPEEFRRYEATFEGLHAITAPTPGNHDWPNRDRGYDPFWRRMLGSTPPPWYAFRAGGWQVLSLNSETDHGPGSPQLRWLRGQLRAPGNCRLAFWHRPRYSAGLHGDQEDVEPITAALEGHASLVLNGHDHVMQRFHPFRGATVIVNGAGGHGHYPLHEHDGLAFKDNRNYGATRIALAPGIARYSFVATSGRVLHRGSVRCRRN